MNTVALLSQPPDMIPEGDLPASMMGSIPPTDQNDGGNISIISKKRSTVEPAIQPLDEAQVIQIATDAFVKELGLEDDSCLKDGQIEIKDVPAGTYLMKEESHKVSIRNPC